MGVPEVMSPREEAQLAQFVQDRTACSCLEPAPVSDCCGEPLDGLRCTQCHDCAGVECATCEREVAR